jgi:hypothetical protein
MSNDAPSPPSPQDDEAVSPAGGETVGQTLGRYKLRERIGEGGYGVVYVAEQEIFKALLGAGQGRGTLRVRAGRVQRGPRAAAERGSLAGGYAHEVRQRTEPMKSLDL